MLAIHRLLNSFQKRLIFIFGGISFISGIIILLIFNSMMRNQIILTQKDNLENISKSIAISISTLLNEREREIVLLSKKLSDANFKDESTRSLVDTISHSYPYYSWIGITDSKGTVICATKGLLENKDVSFRPWFKNSQKTSYVGDLHEAILLEKFLENPNSNVPIRFIDFAAPIFNNGNLKGVVATHTNWVLSNEIVNKFMPDYAKEKSIEAFIIGEKGEIYFPANQMGKVLFENKIPKNNGVSIITDEENQKYLTSYYKVKLTENMKLNWKVIVRQPIEKALIPAGSMQNILISLFLIISCIFIFIAYKMSSQFSQPVKEIVSRANSIVKGKDNITFESCCNIQEFKNLNNSLQIMHNNSQNQQAKLEALNTNLENKIQEYETLFHSTVIPYLIIDKDLNIDEQNEVSKQVFDFNLEVNNSFKSILNNNDEFTIESYLEQRYLGWDVIVACKIYDTSIKRYKIDIVPHPSKHNLYILTMIDIESQYKLLDEIANSAQKDQIMMMQARNATMGEMVANISHQLKQPLSIISTSSSAVLMEKEYEILTNEKIDEYMKLINKNVNHISTTIDTFGNFLKDSSTRKEIILQDEIQDALVISRTAFKSNFIQFIDNIDYENKIYLTMIKGELPQVLINILNNAKDVLIDKNSSDSRWIKLELIKEKDKVVITIEDNAGGIPNKVLPKIFDAYFTTKSEDKGTGLGLHMSYRIVTESLKGKIYAQNTLNGAKFFIELPLNKS